MIKNLTVGIDSDFSGLERGVASLFAQLGRIGQAAVQAGNQIAGGFGQATTAVNQYRDAQGRLREANGRFSGSNNNALGSLGKLTLGYFSVAQALDLLKQGLSIVSDFQRLDGGLKAVSSSATDFAATQAFLRRQSDQLGLSYEVLAGTYKGLKAATNDTALAGAETERIFTSVVRAGAALRLSNEQVEGTLLAIQQMLSKGVVSMEELRQQLGEHLPAAFGLAAKAMGVSTAELNRMVASGNVLAIDLLPKLATELEKAYGAQAQANVNSMAGGFTRATDQLKLFISEFAKSAGVDTFFGKIGNGIANIIKDLRRAQNGDLQTSYDDFLGLSLPEKEKELSRLAGDINRAQAKLNTLIGSSPTDANLKAEASVEKRIDSMKKLYGAYFLAVRDGQNQAAKAAGVGGAKTFDIESAKNRQSELAKGIATARLNGQNPTALQREYDALTARIDAATASTKRGSAAHLASVTALSTNERLLKQYSRALKEYGDTADGARSNMVDLLQAEVAADKARAKGRIIDLGEAGKYTSNKQVRVDSDVSKSIGERLAEWRNPLSALQGLASRFAEVKGFGNLSYYQRQIGELQNQIQGFSLKGLAIPQDVIDRLSEYTNQVQKAGQSLEAANRAADQKRINALPGFTLSNPLSNLKSSLSPLLQIYDDSAATVEGRTAALNQAISGSLRDAASGLAVGFGEFIGNLVAGTAELSDLPAMLGGVLGSLAKTMGQALIAFGTAGIAAKAFVNNPVGAIVAGIALTALGTALQASLQNSASGTFGGKGGKMRAFADGATAYGPTVGVFGEYAGASRNPEFVAPVNKGAGLIAEQLTKMGGLGGGGTATGEFILRGPDLLLAIDRARETKRNYGS